MRPKSKNELLFNMRMNAFNKRFNETPDDTLLLGECKVKLNQEFYNKRIKNNEMSDKFVTWYNENKENTFIAYEIEDRRAMYILDDIKDWIFNYFDLIKVGEKVET